MKCSLYWYRCAGGCQKVLRKAEHYTTEWSSVCAERSPEPGTEPPIEDPATPTAPVEEPEYPTDPGPAEDPGSQPVRGQEPVYAAAEAFTPVARTTVWPGRQ